MKKVLLALLLASASTCVAFADIKQDIQIAKDEWKEDRKKRKDTEVADFSSWLKWKNLDLYNRWRVSLKEKPQPTPTQEQALQKYSLGNAAVDKAAISREVKDRQAAVSLIGGQIFPYTQSLAWAEVTLKRLVTKKSIGQNTLDGFRQAKSPQDKLSFLLKPMERGEADSTSLLRQLLELGREKPVNEVEKLSEYRIIKEILAEEVKHPDVFVAYRSQSAAKTTFLDICSEMVSIARTWTHVAPRIALEDLVQDIDNTNFKRF